MTIENFFTSKKKEILAEQKIKLEQDLKTVLELQRLYGKTPKATIKSLLLIVESTLDSFDY